MANCTRERFGSPSKSSVEGTHTMRGGELYVPELPAYLLADLAEAMGVPLDVVGARPGEKQHESMIGPDEVAGFMRWGNYYVRGPSWSGPTIGGPVTSDTATRLTVDDLRERLRGVA